MPLLCSWSQEERVLSEHWGEHEGRLPCQVILVPFFHDVIPFPQGFGLTRRPLLTDGLSTWILSPEDLHFGEGVYYLTVIPEADLEPTPGCLTTFLSHGVFWDEGQGTWGSSRCQVRRGKRRQRRLVGCILLIYDLPLECPPPLPSSLINSSFRSHLKCHFLQKLLNPLAMVRFPTVN